MTALAPPIAEPVFYLIAMPAVMITVPLLAFAVPPLQAAAIMLPILCVMDLFDLWAYWGRYNRANMAVILPAALVGIGIAWATAGMVSQNDIMLILGAISVLFALRLLVRPSRQRAAAWDRSPQRLVLGHPVRLHQPCRPCRRAAALLLSAAAEA